MFAMRSWPLPKCSMNTIDRTRLQHMRDAAREAIAFASGRTRADLDGDRLLQLALTRLIEIIGEAASQVSGDVRQRHPDIPWPRIVGMRNRLISAYFDVNLDIVWDTITLELPLLVAQIETLLGES
jgi:uncharacterized protein with HEPN domain